MLTNDPNKLKVYTDGYDGHCLRAQSYWPDKMPDIDPTSVTSINSIKKLHKKERQDSKPITFALTYAGTHITLMNNCGFSKEEAKRIEANFHKLYRISDEWIKAIVEEAKTIGYIPMAFGARIRTPLLAKTIGTGKSVPFEAMKEARSAGNAATQSYCALTLRAMNEFRKRVWDSPYIYDILPSATIYDSIYFFIRNDITIATWLNTNLIDCMRWQDMKELEHPTIKISSVLEIFYPSWKDVIEIPNNISEEEIKRICTEAQKEKV